MKGGGLLAKGMLAVRHAEDNILIISDLDGEKISKALLAEGVMVGTDVIILLDEYKLQGYFLWCNPEKLRILGINLPGTEVLLRAWDEAQKETEN